MITLNYLNDETGNMVFSRKKKYKALFDDFPTFHNEQTCDLIDKIQSAIEDYLKMTEAYIDLHKLDFIENKENCEYITTSLSEIEPILDILYSAGQRIGKIAEAEQDRINEIRFMLEEDHLLDRIVSITANN